MKEIFDLNKVIGGIMDIKHYTKETWNAHYLWGLEHPDVIGPPTVPWPYD